MNHFLTKFSSFPNRYYNGDNGKASSNWLYDNLSDIINQNNRRDISIKKVSHRFKQNSIVITVKGSQETDETVIIGSHQDSVNQWLPWFGKAPGADDDGSGTTSVHEAFRVLINGKFKPQRNVEFHFYAGEEGGLLGSQDIARSYAEQKRNIVAMMHFDMTGYFGKKEQIAVVTDHTDPELSQFLKKLISAYSELPQVESQCGYGCSDHASWNKVILKYLY
jgi:leucyl aminopeptidase